MATPKIYSQRNKGAFQVKNLITIVVPTFNRKDLLEKCLKSIDDQSCKNYLVIISDNCSSDATADFLAENYAGKENYTINRNTSNIGLVNNINKALSMVKTPWATILSDDDYLDDDFIQKLDNIIKNCDKDFIAFSHREVNNECQTISEYKLPDLDLNVEESFEMLFSKAAFGALPTAGISGFAFKQDIITDATLKDYFMGFYSDTFLVISSISQKGAKLVSDVLYNRRQWEGAESSRVMKSVKLLYGMYKSNHCFKHDLLECWQKVKQKYKIDNTGLDNKIRKYCKSNYLLELISRRLLKLN